MIVGVDPGLTGAVGILADDGKLVDVWDLPVNDGEVSASQLALAEGWGEMAPSAVVIERVSTRPGEGGARALKIGTNYGVLLGVFGGLMLPIRLVTPAKWKKDMGLSPDKNASRALASRLWPTHADKFRRVKDDGRAEAALIAEWWRTKGRDR
jgi:crossover junction endodeoxyribonuclease RuvC